MTSDLERVGSGLCSGPCSDPDPKGLFQKKEAPKELMCIGCWYEKAGKETLDLGLNDTEMLHVAVQFIQEKGLLSETEHYEYTGLLQRLDTIHGILNNRI